MGDDDFLEAVTHSVLYLCDRVKYEDGVGTGSIFKRVWFMILYKRISVPDFKLPAQWHQIEFMKPALGRVRGKAASSLAG